MNNQDYGTKVLENKYVVTLKQPLGSGSYGSVYKGHLYENENEFIAIKIINKKQFKNQKNKRNLILNYLKRESDNQLQLSSPNIVKMIDVIENDDDCYFILEYCEGGNLQNKLNKGGLPQEEALQIFKQIVNGYKEIREKKIIHRDLKPENILFSNKVAKIGDFGFSKFLEDLDHTVEQSGVGTPYYAAPEIKTKKYSSKADIWSLGVILFSMIYGTIPTEIQQQLNFEKSKIESIKCPENKKIPGDVINLLKKMLVVNPERRICWDELFAENLLQLIEPQKSEIQDIISEQKANKIKQDLQNQNKVENIYQYFAYISELLQFIQSLMKDVQILNSIVQFSRAQQFSYSLITTKYMVNEIKVYQGILKGQNLFQTYIICDDFELFKKSDKYYQTLNNFNKNYENLNKSYLQTKGKFDMFREKNDNQKNLFNNLIEALEQVENNQQFCQTYNQIYYSIIDHIIQKLYNIQITNEEKNNFFKVLIKLLHCLQPLKFSHHKLDAFQIEQQLLNSSNLEKEFKDLYENIQSK